MPLPVEVLASYSHSAQAADLRVCGLTATRDERPETKSATAAPWSLRERLSDDMIRSMVCAYRAGATARDLVVAHKISLSSVKRLLRAAKVRKSGATR